MVSTSRALISSGLSGALLALPHLLFACQRGPLYQSYSSNWQSSAFALCGQVMASVRRTGRKSKASSRILRRRYQGSDILLNQLDIPLIANKLRLQSEAPNAI